MWEDVDFERQNSLRTFEDWLQFEVRDVTQIFRGNKRHSRLSSYALQSFTDPSFRNQSVLSIYKDTDNFQLPKRNSSKGVDQSAKMRERTASMFLYPQDTLNVSATEEPIKHESPMNPPLGHSRKISHVSKATNISSVIKDLECPTSPSVDKVIPPTPAKKVEFMLRSSYLPRGLPRENGERSNAQASCAQDQDQHHHRGILGLLSKWKKNHKVHVAKTSYHDRLIEPEIDNLIKYIFSISSLEAKNNDVKELFDSVSSKFDILSARTIDEVEYLLSVENDLLHKLQHTQDTQHPVKVPSNNNSNQDFSVMDNLNLYKTVNSIATSVISLSRTLSQHQQQTQQRQQQQQTQWMISPSNAAKQRRRPQSSAAALWGNGSHHSITSILLARAATPTFKNDSPKKLVFHNSGSIKKTWKHSVSDSGLVTPTKSNFIGPLKPLNNNTSLHDLEEVNSSGSEVEKTPEIDRAESLISSVTYDSQFSNNGSNMHVQLQSPLKTPDGPLLKRKENHYNLREFNFEEKVDGKNVIESEVGDDGVDDGEGVIDEGIDDGEGVIGEGVGDDVDDDDDIDNGEFDDDVDDDDDDGVSSFITSYEEEMQDDTITELAGEKQPETRTNRAFSSGRISILRRSPMNSPNREVQSPSQPVFEDPSFVEKDEMLRKNEIELCNLQTTTSVIISVPEVTDKRRISRDIDVESVNTDLLLQSAHASPEKLAVTENTSEHLDVLDGGKPGDVTGAKLTSTPSIHSIVSGESISSFNTVDTFDKCGGKTTTNNFTDLRQQFQNQKMSLGSADFLLDDECTDDAFKNKYLFSPDIESLDNASPEKNVEELKNKFLGCGEDEDEDGNEDEDKDEEEDQGEEEEEDCDHDNDEKPEHTAGSYHVTHKNHQEEVACGTPHANHRRSVTPILSPTATDKNRLTSIANMTDDSFHEDPVNIALMKLEGTYKKTSGDNDATEASTADSPTSSALAREVDNLHIADIQFPNGMDAKRRSMFIERRRQTMVDLPFTPSSRSIDKDEVAKTSEEQIRELLQNYKLQDPRLHINNIDQHVPFILMYDSLSIAKQMTLIEKEVLSEVDWKDLLDLNATEKLPQVTSWLQLLVQNESMTGIDLAIARFNLTVDWIMSEIVMTKDIKLRRNTIQRFIHVAEHCKDFQNYNTLLQIVLALNSIVVQKFTDTWRLIEPGDLLTWEELKKVPSLDGNYSNVRKLLNEINPIKGCIPFIVVYLSDLSLNAEKKNWIIPNKVVNYSKFQTNVQIVKNFIQRVQWSKFYDIEVDNELLSKCVYISCLTHEEIKHLATIT